MRKRIGALAVFSVAAILLAAVLAVARASHTTERHISPNRNATLRLEVTRLTRDLVLAAPWTADPFVRGRTKELLSEDLLLLQVTLTNASRELFSFPLSSYYLVDDLGHQYSPAHQWIPLRSNLVGTIVPAAKASGVLVFPTPKPGARTVTLYVQTGSTLEAIVTYLLHTEQPLKARQDRANHLARSCTSLRLLVRE